MGGTAGADDGRGWLDLSDAVDLLRGQVVEAQRRAEAADVRFELGEITVEFGVELGRTVAGSGGLRFYVVSADARRERNSRAVHKVTVTLRAKQPDGSPVDIGDSDEG